MDHVWQKIKCGAVPHASLASMRRMVASVTECGHARGYKWGPVQAKLP